MTLVLNLSNNDEYLYSVPPEEAVELAYKQFKQKDFNTWDYKNKKVSIIRTERTVSCGEFVALLQKEKKEIQGELF